MFEDHTWNRFRNGDIQSFETIYDEYASELFRYGKSFSQDSHLIDESIQELFVYLWNKRKSIGPTTSIKFYLLRSFRRLLTRRIKQTLRYSYNVEAEGDYIFDPVSSPEKEFILNEEAMHLKSTLLDAVKDLPVNQREVIYLRYYQELSYDEIASIIGGSKKTAYNLVYLALNTLRKRLKSIAWLIPTVLYLLFILH